MTWICNVIEDLLRGGVSVKEAKILADSSFLNKSFKKRVLFKILKQIKEVKNTKIRGSLIQKGPSTHCFPHNCLPPTRKQTMYRICLKALLSP
jgi:hypothetical protein